MPLLTPLYCSGGLAVDGPKHAATLNEVLFANNVYLFFLRPLFYPNDGHQQYSQ